MLAYKNKRKKIVLGKKSIQSEQKTKKPNPDM